MLRSLICAGIVALTPLAGWAEASTPTPTPDWGSDQVGAARSLAPVPALTFNLERQTPWAASETGTVILAPDFTEVTIGDQHRIDDFALCRSLAWRDGGATLDNQSCYVSPGSRLAELENRRVQYRALESILHHSSAHPDTEMLLPYWSEQSLAIQDAPSQPLVARATARETEWRLGDHVVVRTSTDGFDFTPAERQAVARYLSRHVDLHPQVRQAILVAGRLPATIIIERKDLNQKGTETLRFTAFQRRDVVYDLPAHRTSSLMAQAKADAVEAAGLQQALLAIAGTATPPRQTLDALFGRLQSTAIQQKNLEAVFVLLQISMQYGGVLQSDPIHVTRLRAMAPSLNAAFADPEVQAFDTASQLAGGAAKPAQAEAAARYLAQASKLDAIPFGTFRYVTFANLVRRSRDVQTWDKSILASMPSVPDCYWTHIAANPWASNPYKDLGDYWYGAFHMDKAWAAWDLGRAVDPDWRLGLMKEVGQYEDKLRKVTPDDF